MDPAPDDERRCPAFSWVLAIVSSFSEEVARWKVG